MDSGVRRVGSGDSQRDGGFREEGPADAEELASVIGSDVPWLECPACNALTWVITVTE